MGKVSDILMALLAAIRVGKLRALCRGLGNAVWHCSQRYLVERDELGHSIPVWDSRAFHRSWREHPSNQPAHDLHARTGDRGNPIYPDVNLDEWLEFLARDGRKSNVTTPVTNNSFSTGPTEHSDSNVKGAGIDTGSHDLRQKWRELNSVMMELEEIGRAS